MTDAKKQDVEERVDGVLVKYLLSSDSPAFIQDRPLRIERIMGLFKAANLSIVDSDSLPQWRPIEEAPKDGSPVAACETYRWKVYKPGASKSLLEIGGRWQRANGYGGWDNCEPPTHFLPSPPQEQK